MTLLLLLCFETAVAQSIDSLSAAAVKKTGREKVDAYRELFQMCVKVSDEQGQYKYLDSMRAAARIIHNDTAYTYAWLSKIGVYYNYGHRETVQDSIKPFMKYTEKIGYWERYYYAWSIYIDCYFFRGEYLSAMREVERLQKDAHNRSNEVGMAWALRQSGQIYSALSSYGAAQANLSQAIDLMRRQKEIDYSALSRVYNAYANAVDGQYLAQVLGRVVRGWQQCLDEWREKLVREGAPLTSLTIHQIQCNQKKMSVYVYAGDSVAAWKLLVETDSLAKGKNPMIQAMRDMMYSRYYRLTKDFPKALMYIDKAIAAREKIKKGQALFSERLARAQLLGFMGRYDEAFAVYKEINPKRDSLSNVRIQQTTMELDALLTLDNKTANAKRQVEQQKEKNAFLTLISVLAVTLILGIYFLRRHRLLKTLREKDKSLSAINEQLQDAYNKKMELSRMKEVFVLNFSHKLQTPLLNLDSFIGDDIKRMPTMTSEERHKSITSLRQNVDHITTMVNELLQQSDTESKT